MGTEAVVTSTGLAQTVTTQLPKSTGYIQNQKGEQPREFCNTICLGNSIVKQYLLLLWTTDERTKQPQCRVGCSPYSPQLTDIVLNATDGNNNRMQSRALLLSLTKSEGAKYKPGSSLPFRRTLLGQFPISMHSQKK